MNLYNRCSLFLLVAFILSTSMFGANPFVNKGFLPPEIGDVRIDVSRNFVAIIPAVSPDGRLALYSALSPESECAPGYSAAINLNEFQEDGSREGGTWVDLLDSSGVSAVLGNFIRKDLVTPGFLSIPAQSLRLSFQYQRNFKPGVYYRIVPMLTFYGGIRSYCSGNSGKEYIHDEVPYFVVGTPSAALSGQLPSTGDVVRQGSANVTVPTTLPNNSKVCAFQFFGSEKAVGNCKVVPAGTTSVVLDASEFRPGLSTITYVLDLKNRVSVARISQ